MEETVEYRGYVIFWRRFSNDGPWLASIAAASPSLFPATTQSAATDIHGRNRDDMLANAKFYIDRLRPNGALSSAELREPSII
jgi:hypothetical protein